MAIHVTEQTEGQVTTRPNHLEDFLIQHQQQARMLANHMEEEGDKAIVITGPVHSGKTSLAYAVSRILSDRNSDTATIFTTPAISETRNAREITDRTGVTFTHIPGLEEVEAFPGKTFLVVINELSMRSPYMINMWKGLIAHPKTKFLMLAYPGSQFLDK